MYTHTSYYIIHYMLTQHYNDVRVLVNKGVVSDSFTKKMAEQFPDRSNIAINEIRKNMSMLKLFARDTHFPV